MDTPYDTPLGRGDRNLGTQSGNLRRTKKECTRRSWGIVTRTFKEGKIKRRNHRPESWWGSGVLSFKGEMLKKTIS